MIFSPLKKDQCFVYFKLLYARTTTGLPTLLPMCKCPRPPERNSSKNKTLAGPAQDFIATVRLALKAMVQCIMETLTHLPHLLLAVLQIGMEPLQGSPPPPQFPPTQTSTRPSITLHRWPRPYFSPPRPPAPRRCTARSSPCPHHTRHSHSLQRDFLRWKTSLMSR